MPRTAAAPPKAGSHGLSLEQLQALQEVAVREAQKVVHCADPGCPLMKSSGNDAEPKGWRCRFHERPDHQPGSMMGCSHEYPNHWCPVHTVPEVRESKAEAAKR